MKTIKVVAMSDLHGVLPPPKIIPKCDLILIGGDICASHVVLDQSIWLNLEFKPWLEKLPADKIIGIAGNHDFIWEKAPHFVPKLPWTYLQDNSCEFKEWKIYGSPWQLRFYDWAFNLDEPELERKWQFIPENTDILLLHGPPKGYGDHVKRDENVGSPSLIKRIQEVKPKLVVYGHIHAGFGVYECSGTTLANVSIVNEQYRWTNLPTEFLLDSEARRTTAQVSTFSRREEKVINWEADSAEVTTT